MTIHISTHKVISVNQILFYKQLSRSLIWNTIWYRKGSQRDLALSHLAKVIQTETYQIELRLSVTKLQTY